MTNKEREEMMAEIMQVVDKHISKSEKKQPVSENKYGGAFGISDEAMAKWKEEYRKMRVDTKAVLEEVKRTPIDTSKLSGCPSFDLDRETFLLM